MSSSNQKLSPKPTAQVEQNASDGRSDNCQEDSQPIRSIRSRIEQLTQQNSNINETTNVNLNIKPYSNATISQQRQPQVSSVKGEPSNNGINDQQVKKIKNVINAINELNNNIARKSPPPKPSKPPISGGIKHIIPPSPSVLENSVSPTLLNLPNSAPLPKVSYYNVSDDDNDDPFDDSKEVNPFADVNEMDDESLTTSSSRSRRHSHTFTSPRVTSRVIKNDNSIGTNSNLHRNSPSKPSRKQDNLIPNSSRVLQRYSDDDSENRPSLPSKPIKSDRQTPPPLPDRPRNLDQNDKEKNKSKRRQKDASGSDSDPSTDHVLDTPDATRANRRPPRFNGIKDINSKVTTRTFAIAGKLVVTGSGHTRIWSLVDGVNFRIISSHDDSKVTSLCWRPTRRVEDVGRYILCGSQDGCLFAIDTIDGEKYFEINKKAHNSQINFILRHEFQLWTLDESGKLQIWSDNENGVVSLKSKPQTVKVSPKANSAIVVGHHLWLSFGKTIEVFNPLGTSVLLVKTIELGIDIGSIKCMTQTNNSSLVYVGHDDGKITVWNVQTYKLESTVTVSFYCINSLLGVGDYLWVGFKTGMIYIYDARSNPWIVIKEWQAHKAPIADMQLDETGLWRVDRLQVASLSDEGQIIAWDGLMHEDWIADEMAAREDQYCNYREVKILICSWNIDASKPAHLESSGDDRRFLRSWFQSTESPDIIVVGFQEIIDLESKTMNAKSMFLGKKKSAKQLSENVTQRYKLWYEKLVEVVRQYTNDEYEVLISDNLVGLFTCIFAKRSESYHIRDKDVVIKKTGLKGLHGNKGSIAIRLIYDDSSICFVNCHLAAGQGQTKERNTDVANILDNSAFPSRSNDSRNDEGVFTHGGDGSMILDHEIVFFSGDLNYRIDLPRDDVIEAIDNKNYSVLLEHDQLLKQMKKNPRFRLRSFSERVLKFAPTYKYDRGEDIYDTSEKRRTPAWCDRILYFGNNVKQEHYKRYECRVSDHRPISGAFTVRIKTIREDYKAEVKGRVERAWNEKVKEKKNEIMVRWIKDCGWDEHSAIRALEENHGMLRKAVDELNKRDERGKKK